MASTTDGLIRLLSLVDRPDCDKVVARAKRAQLLPKIVRPLAAAAVAYVLAAGLGRLGTEAAIYTTAIVGGLFALVAYLDEVLPKVERHHNAIAKVAGGLGLFIGVAVQLVDKKELWITLATGVGAFIVMWVITQFGLTLFTLLVSLINIVLRAFASPIAVPVLAVVAWLNNRAVKKSGWTTSTGTPIAQFNREGIKTVHHANEPIFVSSPHLRMGGAALAAGIPLFSHAELFNSSLVTQRMNEAYQVISEEWADVEPANYPLPVLAEINPASGLPMFDGIGGLDVMGNAYGTVEQHFHHDAGIQNNGFDHG